jgi:hypothetical protein
MTSTTSAPSPFRSLNAFLICDKNCNTDQSGQRDVHKLTKVQMDLSFMRVSRQVHPWAQPVLSLPLPSGQSQSKLQVVPRYQLLRRQNGETRSTEWYWRVWDHTKPSDIPLDRRPLPSTLKCIDRGHHADHHRQPTVPFSALTAQWTLRAPSRQGEGVRWHKRARTDLGPKAW